MLAIQEETNKTTNYHAYKPSHIDWIGDIPQHWEIKKIKNIISKIMGGGTPSTDKDEYWNGDIPWVSAKDMKHDYISFSEDYITQLAIKESSTTLIQENNVLIVARSGILKHTLPVAINTKKVTINQDLKAIEVSKKLTDYKFMFWLLKGSSKSILTYCSKVGATVDSIDMENFFSFKTPLPPLSEQQAIVTYLDQKTALIDELIDKKQRKIDLLKEQRTALINHAVTKGLNPNVNFKDSGIEWIGEIPEHWKVKKLKFVAKNIFTGSTPPTENEAYFEDGRFDWFTPADFTENIILYNSKRKITDLALSQSKIKTYPPNSILFVGIGATLGKVGVNIKECASNQQINAIIIDDKNTSFFIAFFLKNNIESIRILANTATLPILNQTQTNEITVPYPPLTEQQAIVAYLDEQTALVDKAIVLEVQKIEKLKEYRQSLISAVVTGKICVLPFTEKEESKAG